MYFNFHFAYTEIKSLQLQVCLRYANTQRDERRNY